MPGIPPVSKLLLGAKLGLAQALYPLEPGRQKRITRGGPGEAMITFSWPAENAIPNKLKITVLSTHLE